MTLMLHCGGHPVSFDGLGGFELPAETASYKPVAHQDLIRMAEKRTRLELDYDGDIEWAHGVNRGGRQYFGIAKFPGIPLTDLHCLSMGLRNSYDKTMAGALAFGINCFVCDNLSFAGSMITVMRKHTVNVMRDLRRLFMEALDGVKEDAKVHAQAIESWSEYPMTHNEGYEVIGLLRGHGLIDPPMTQRLFTEWQEPAFDEFEVRNVWTLYNSTTAAIKEVTPGRALKTYSGVYDFFKSDVVDAKFQRVN